MSARDCVFCEIVAGCAPALIVPTFARDVVAFEPLDPVTDGHALFVPRRHVENAASDPQTTALVMLEAASYARGLDRPFNLITSAGGPATQTVFHLHIHYLPRRSGDELALPWTGQRANALPSAVPTALFIAPPTEET